MKGDRKRSQDPGWGDPWAACTFMLISRLVHCSEGWAEQGAGSLSPVACMWVGSRGRDKEY